MPVQGDIFNRGQEFGNAQFITSDFMILTAPGGQSGEEYLVQQVAIQYNQPVNRVFEIGSGNTYFAPGRSIGSAQIGKIIGSTKIDAVLGAFGTGVWTTDVSGNNGEKTLVFSGVGERGQNLRYIMKGAVVESYAISTDANGLLIQENVSIQFASLTTQ